MEYNFAIGRSFLAGIVSPTAAGYDFGIRIHAIELDIGDSVDFGPVIDILVE